MPMCRIGQDVSPYVVLRGVTLDIDGQRYVDVDRLPLSCEGITVVMGPNGAGKSLLLRLLHGLVRPTSGDILYRDQKQTSQELRKQSLVLQTPVLLRRSAEANVRFVLKARGLNLSRVSELLAWVGLEGKARAPARRLSGGERQRLAIAQALATNPDLLLLDEPTASLDPRSTILIERILRDTVARGTRVLMVTHDALQARRLADEIVFLSNGKVVEQSPAKAFFATPQTGAARHYLTGRLEA